MLYKALRQKDIKIDGKRINKDCNIYDGNEIQVFISDSFLCPEQTLNIVFEDDNILIINKPAALEVTGDNSLTTIVHNKFANNAFLPMPCHRLDRNTNGLVLFAKNEQVLNILFDKFKNHEIQKKYLALVYGIPKIKKARQLRNTIFILLRFIQIQLNVFQSIIVLDVGIELSPYIYIQKITKIMP